MSTARSKFIENVRKLTRTRESPQHYKAKKYPSSILKLFKCTPVKASNKNIRLGDHIVFPRPRRFLKRRLYEHHMLICGIKDANTFEAIEYTGDFKMANVLKMVFYQDLECLAKIRIREYTYEGLEKDRAFLVEWPEGLRRYDRHKVIERAHDWQNNNYPYCILTNNCEHFVTWCISGQHVSLQLNIRRRCIVLAICAALSVAKSYIGEEILDGIENSKNLSEDVRYFLKYDVQLPTTIFTSSLYEAFKARELRKIVPSKWLSVAVCSKVVFKKFCPRCLDEIELERFRHDLGPHGRLKICGANIMLGHIIGAVFTGLAYGRI